MISPSPRQADVLRFVDNHGQLHGFAPTIREIGVGLGIASTNGVNCHLQALERKGLIERRNTTARSIQLTGSARKLLGSSTQPDAIRKAVAAERQACADLVRSYCAKVVHFTGKTETLGLDALADLILARGGR